MTRQFSWFYVPVALLILFLTFAVYVIYFYVFRHPDAYGNFDLSALASFRAPLIASVGTFLGVVSKVTLR
jgi:hypothetical protein